MKKTTMVIKDILFLPVSLLIITLDSILYFFRNLWEALKEIFSDYEKTQAYKSHERYMAGFKLRPPQSVKPEIVRLVNTYFDEQELIKLGGLQNVVALDIADRITCFFEVTRK